MATLPCTFTLSHHREQLRYTHWAIYQLLRQFPSCSTWRQVGDSLLWKSREVSEVAQHGLLWLWFWLCLCECRGTSWHMINSHRVYLRFFLVTRCPTCSFTWFIFPLFTCCAEKSWTWSFTRDQLSIDSPKEQVTFSSSKLWGNSLHRTDFMHKISLPSARRSFLLLYNGSTLKSKPYKGHKGELFPKESFLLQWEVVCVLKGCK